MYILSIRRNIHTLPHQSCKVEHFSQLKRCNNIEETSARNVAALKLFRSLRWSWLSEEAVCGGYTRSGKRKVGTSSTSWTEGRKEVRE